MLKQEKYPAALFCLCVATIVFVAAVLRVTAPAVSTGAYSVEPERNAQVETTLQRPLLDINTATAAQLEQLHGVGAVLAGRIVSYREENGAFHSMEELLNVKGIGEKTLAAFRHEITLGG